MTKGTYNYNKLVSYCNDNQIILLKDYKDINVTRDTFIIGKCNTSNCNNEFNKSFRQLKVSGSHCIFCTKNNMKIKVENTCLKNYGVKSVFQCKEMRDNMTKSIIDKYGVNNVSKLKEIQLKKENTCMKNHGVKVSFNSSKIKEEITNTYIEKYGVEYPQQLPEIAEKSSKNSYRKKTYTLPSGKELLCQGYEPLALNKLVKEDNILEEDIVTGCKNVPQIWYNDENGKKHRHYVDIYIRSQNRCIEVKSTWTAEKKKDKIYLKQNAAKELGYNYEIWIYNSKKELIEIKI
jgi:hypothetical protein